MGAAMARRVRKVKRREFGAGAVRQLPSGRWQARYRDDTGVMRSAPTTFDTKLDAGAWLDSQDPDDVEELRADPPLRDYAQGWLAGRELKPRTRESYRLLLDRQVLPVLGQTKMGRLTPVAVRAWHAGLDPSKATTRSHAYLLLHAICATAVDDELLASNPCRVRGAGQVKTTHTTKVATLPELAVMTEAMPARFKMMVLLAAWCGLRYGELTELRRADIDGDGVRVERGVVRVGGQFVVGDPKSAPAPDPAAGRPPRTPRRGRARCAAVPGAARRPPGAERVLPGVVPGAGGRGPTRPALPRSAPHRGDAGRRDRGNAARPDGAARAQHPRGVAALPAHDRGPRPSHRGGIERVRGGRRGDAHGSLSSYFTADGQVHREYSVLGLELLLDGLGRDDLDRGHGRVGRRGGRGAALGPVDALVGARLVAVSRQKLA
jgi:hypothetical protein